MKKTVLLLSALWVTVTYAQKKVDVNKSSIEVDGQVVAEYDSKGGVFSSNRKIWLLSPTTKDTLLVVYPMTTDVDNPMVELDVLYKLCFYNAEKTVHYFQNPKGWGAIGKESKILGLFFNEKLPLVIENGKLSETGITAFREKTGLDMEQIINNAKQVSDLVIETKNKIINRDKATPVEFRPVNKNYLPRFYVAGPSAYQTFEIWQGGAVIGALEKEVTGGSFAKGKYNFYKAVTPFKVGDKYIQFIPLAFSETSPGITSTVTSGKINVKLYSINSSFDLAPGVYNTAEYSIAKSLIDRGAL
jgi:hypothetical protein